MTASTGGQPTLGKHNSTLYKNNSMLLTKNTYLVVHHEEAPQLRWHPSFNVLWRSLSFDIAMSHSMYCGYARTETGHAHNPASVIECGLVHPTPAG
jgi:hypothetical protein